MKYSPVVLVFVCFGSLFLLCFSQTLFEGRQFGFRDAGHYYYPLHQRVQEEWNQGRWPLWAPEENGGVPLLGDPTAGVLYPGKLVFAVLPYAWGARIYIVMHTALAFVAMLVLLRFWGISWSGSGLGALSYTFGGPILFQYCNVIFLVGAAWLPLGMHAVDGWVRLGRRWGLWELAAVLAMQVLGGDPETAYLLGLAGAGYALGLAWTRARARKAGEVRKGDRVQISWARSWSLAVLLIAAVLVWSAATVALGVLLPKLRGLPHPGEPPAPLRWMVWMPGGVAVAWGLAGLGFLYFYYWRRRGWRLPLGAMWLGLVMAAATAAMLTAAQLLPVVEFTQRTSRAGTAGPHRIYRFSVEPYRLVELLWPNIWGTQFGGNSFWAELIWIPGVSPGFWVPSLYLGGMTVILAASAFAFRRGPSWRVWLSAIAVVGLVGALGKYTSPIWVARAAVAMSHSRGLERLASGLGQVDDDEAQPIRPDGYFHDGDGSVYWSIATFLPGFRQFRFPGKLFTFVSLALAALAAVGWDQCSASRARRTILSVCLLIVVSLCILAGVVFERQPILAAFGSSGHASLFGPLDAAKGYEAIVRSLVHCSIVLGLGLVLLVQAPARPRLAGAAAVILMTLDLAAANSRCVVTVDQSLFEGQSAVLRAIEEAERDKPASGPFRVHRTPGWDPLVWQMARSADRDREFLAWDRDTIRPRFGINFGIEYTHAIGFAELDEYERYFIGFSPAVTNPGIAKILSIEVGKQVLYLPRRAYDMWNTRYFVVPFNSNGWNDPTRASAGFLFASESICPENGRFDGPDGKQESKKWLENNDFWVLRNAQEFPRSWVVHKARRAKPSDGRSPQSRLESMREILYAEDPLWYQPGLRVFNPRHVAWLNRTDLSAILPKLSGQLPAESESVKVSYPSPQRAVLEVTLESSGLVILSDVYYPGWQLTIDGQPAPIYRVNVVMRGALVSAGRHRLVYTFVPRSFQVGLMGSIAGMAAWLSLGLVCMFRPIHSLLGSKSWHQTLITSGSSSDAGSFSPQRLDGVEHGGAAGGVDAEDHADRDGDQEGDDRRPGPDDNGHSR